LESVRTPELEIRKLHWLLLPFKAHCPPYSISSEQPAILVNDFG
jgi:hypothetical protein